MIWRTEAFRRLRAKTICFESVSVIADRVTDNTPVQTGNELEPKCNWKMNAWYGLLWHSGMYLAVLNFTLKAALGSLRVGIDWTVWEQSLIVEGLTIHKWQNEMTVNWSVLRFTFLHSGCWGWRRWWKCVYRRFCLWWLLLIYHNSSIMRETNLLLHHGGALFSQDFWLQDLLSLI